MKKITALLLIMVFALCLAACNEQETPDSGNTQYSVLEHHPLLHPDDETPIMEEDGSAMLGYYVIDFDGKPRPFTGDEEAEAVFIEPLYYAFKPDGSVAGIGAPSNPQPKASVLTLHPLRSPQTGEALTDETGTPLVGYYILDERTGEPKVFTDDPETGVPLDPPQVYAYMEDGTMRGFPAAVS